MKTSIQGYKGSFHHQVANELGLAEELLFQDHFDNVFADVIEGRADYGIVAIENSIAGAILENYDRLKNSGLKVVGEYYLRIKMNLLGLPGQTETDIKEVTSHPMAIKQCRKYLESHPYMKASEHVDTALAVQEIIEGKKQGVAGIAGEFAAEALGAEIIAAGIETDPANYTRFLVVARHDNAMLQTLEYPSNGKKKSSLYLETSHEPGALLRVLEIFERIGLNMTMLVSRPVIGEAWNYGFYIDFEAKGVDEIALKNSLSTVADKLLLFGIYPAYKREQ